MATYTKYEPFIQRLANKEIDWFGATDTWKAAIHTDAPDTANDDDLADLTQIAGNNGYTTGGENITFNSTALVARLPLRPSMLCGRLPAATSGVAPRAATSASMTTRTPTTRSRIRMITVLRSRSRVARL